VTVKVSATPLFNLVDCCKTGTCLHLSFGLPTVSRLCTFTSPTCINRTHAFIFGQQAWSSQSAASSCCQATRRRASLKDSHPKRMLLATMPQRTSVVPVACETCRKRKTRVCSTHDFSRDAIEHISCFTVRRSDTSVRSMSEQSRTMRIQLSSWHVQARCTQD
jgi:hypothetical protein